MSKDAFNERRKALENEFFYQVDEKLLTAMKAKTVAETNRRQLGEATGIADSELLDELFAAGASAETVAAISLVPLILVAWADGKMDPEEREPIVNAAIDQAILSGSPGAELLEHWLNAEPKGELASTWKHYITAIMEQMSDEAKVLLRSDILMRAKAVANASGGILGFGKVSSEEKRVIAELEQALTP